MNVLLIENHRARSQSLKLGLEERGFAVDVAYDGREGDGKARTLGYRVIVLNRMLPHGDGLSLLPAWRRAGVTADVCVLTPNRGPEDAVRCLDLGADAYLIIPFEPEELFARLRALLRRGRPMPEAVLRIHDLEIDTAARAVKRRDKAIALTPREFALLEFLARRRGRVVSRAMLCTQLYERPEMEMSNVIDVYIRYLRTKVDKGFDLPLILTRRGEGYLVRGDEG